MSDQRGDNNDSVDARFQPAKRATLGDRNTASWPYVMADVGRVDVTRGSRAQLEVAHSIRHFAVSATSPPLSGDVRASLMFSRE